MIFFFRTRIKISQAPPSSEWPLPKFDSVKLPLLISWSEGWNFYRDISVEHPDYAHPYSEPVQDHLEGGGQPSSSIFSYLIHSAQVSVTKCDAKLSNRVRNIHSCRIPFHWKHPLTVLQPHWLRAPEGVNSLVVIKVRYNLTKDGARHPRTLKMFVCYLLRGFSTDRNETWHGKGPSASEFWNSKRLPWKFGSFKFEDGARQPRTFLRTEPGSLGHFVWRSQAASDILRTEPGSLGHFVWRRQAASIGHFVWRRQAALSQIRVMVGDP